MVICSLYSTAIHAILVLPNLHFDLMIQIPGKYQLERNENLVQYLTQLGEKIELDEVPLRSYKFIRFSGGKGCSSRSTEARARNYR